MSRLMGWLSQQGICAITGSLAGSFSGGIFGLWLATMPAHGVLARQALVIGGALGLIAWFGILFLLLASSQYALHTILIPSLVTSLVASIATAVVLNAIHLSDEGILIGWILGFLIGRLFCAACKGQVINVIGVKR